MPWGDGTGPWWGRGNWMCRRGFGRGYGMGFGRRAYWAAGYAPYGAYQPYSPPAPTGSEEASQLREYISGLEAELNDAKKRLSELEGNK